MFGRRNELWAILKDFEFIRDFFKALNFRRSLQKGYSNRYQPNADFKDKRENFRQGMKR